MPIRIRFNVKAGLPNQVSVFRCGAEHTVVGSVWNEGDWTENEWERLAGDPMLIVEDAGDEEPDAPVVDALSDEELDALVAEKIAGLGSADFTGGGKPKVDVLHALLPAHEARIDSALRDRVWARIEAEREAKANGEGS